LKKPITFEKLFEKRRNFQLLKKLKELEKTSKRFERKLQKLFKLLFDKLDLKKLEYKNLKIFF
jgi:hypothetical protein